jgi:hypothetical protein
MDSNKFNPQEAKVLIKFPDNTPGQYSERQRKPIENRGNGRMVFYDIADLEFANFQNNVDIAHTITIKQPLQPGIAPHR